MAETISTTLALGGNHTLNVGAGGQLTLSGVISGPAGSVLGKSGAGTLVLSGTNTFGTAAAPGGVNITQGVLSISNDNQLGTAPTAATAQYLVINGGTFRYTGGAGAFSATRGWAVGPAGQIDFSGATVETYAGSIANATGTTGVLSKTGLGTLSLLPASAAAQSTFTGGVKVTQGTFAFTFPAAGTAPTSNIIPAASTLTLGGPPQSSSVLSGSPTTPAGLLAAVPALSVTAATSVAASTQTLAGVTLNQGNSQLVLAGGAAGFAGTLNLGAITRNPGATCVFTFPAATSGIMTTTTANNSAGMLGSWATAGANWATGGGTMAGYSAYTVVAANGTIPSAVGSNVQITNGTTVSSNPIATGVTTDINTLQIAGANSATVTIPSAASTVLRLGASGGIWRADTSVSGGIITIGSAAGIGVLTAGGADNTPGEIVINVGSTSNNNSTITINSNINDNGAGAVTLIKTGFGDLKLGPTSTTVPNTYSGGTFINSGRVNAAQAATNLGTGPVSVLLDGEVFLGGFTYANNFTIAGPGTNESAAFGALRLASSTTTATIVTGTITLASDARIGSNGAVGTLAGKITGAGNLDLTAVAASVYTLSNPSNDFPAEISASTASRRRSATRTW